MFRQHLKSHLNQTKFSGKLILYLSIITTGLWLSDQAQGFSLFDSIIDPYETQFEQTTSQITGYFSDFNLDGWGEELKGQISGNLGNLGLPDFSNLKAQISQIFSEQGNSEQSDEALNKIIRDVTRINAGTPSQQARKQQLEAVNQTVRAIEADGNAAQQATVTQDVLKQVASQNSKQSMVMGSLAAQIGELNTKQDLANQNLANVSEALDSQNLARQTDAEATSNSLLHTSSFFRIGDY